MSNFIKQTTNVKSSNRPIGPDTVGDFSTYSYLYMGRQNQRSTRNLTAKLNQRSNAFDRSVVTIPSN